MVNLADTDVIQDEFGMFGVKLQSEDVVDQMKTLCIKYQLDAPSIVSEWLVYSKMAVSKSKKEIILDPKQLAHFEATHLERRTDKTSSSVSSTATADNSTNESFRTPTRVKQPPNFSSASGQKSLKQPDTGIKSANFVDETRSTLKKSVKPLVTYHERKNRGDVIAGLGGLPVEMTWTNLPKAEYVTVIPADPTSFLSEPYPYMFTKYQEVAWVLNCKIDEIGEAIADEHNLQNFGSPAVISTDASEKTTILGRVLPNEEGGLNSRNLWFQTSSTFHNGIKSPLDVDVLDRFGLFPGQVFACDGHSTGSSFTASKFYPGAAPKITKVGLKKAPSSSLHIMVACGPFNIMGESLPDPLKDLVTVVAASQPDVVILMGPFVDARLAQDIEGFMNEMTFEDYFKSMISFVLEEIVDKLGTHVVIQPSVGQLVGMPVYPIPPFTLKDCVANPALYSTAEFLRKITFVPEPALLDINGITIGLTSTDIISHLCQREITKGIPMTEERLPRLAKHLVLQQSFYPLYPPEISADSVALQQYAKIRQKPDLMITASDMKGFVKNINGTVFLNPERLAKGYAGGCFARILISGNEEKSEDEPKERQTADRITVDITRI